MPENTVQYTADNSNRKISEHGYKNKGNQRVLISRADNFVYNPSRKIQIKIRGQFAEKGFCNQKGEV